MQHNRFHITASAEDKWLAFGLAFGAFLKRVADRENALPVAPWPVRPAHQ